MATNVEKIYDTSTIGNTAVNGASKTESAADDTIFKNVQKLKSQYQDTLNEQGFLGKIWNNFKNFTTLGLGSDDVEESIEQYQDGEITYEEALDAIESFEEKQEGAVDIISNTASGVATAGIAAAGVATGGGAIVLGAAVGGVVKAGLKTADRATNEIEGDALDAVQIAKDGITGAVDGAISIATAGIGASAIKPLNQTASIAGKKVSQIALQGAIDGSVSGAISSGAAGATEYTVNSLLDEDKTFTLEGLADNTAQNVMAGAAFGGLTGAASNVIQFKITESKAYKEFQNSANELAEKYASNIDSVESEIKEKFADISVLKEENISLRAKDNEKGSVLSKLISKFKKTSDLTATDVNSCASQIGDGYGARLSLDSLSEEKAKSVIEEALEGSGKTYDDFVSALKNGDELNDEFQQCLDKLKETQTSELFDRLLDLIESKRISLADDEFNNYGNEITSYFTDEQLLQIAQAYQDATGKSLNIVNNTEFDATVTKSYLGDDGKITTEEVEVAQFGKEAIQKANKKSGYPDVQMNVVSTKTTGAEIADTEIQIRGTEVNDFAEIEHLFYDLMQGKVDKTDSNYGEILPLIERINRSGELADEYYAYIKQTYKVKRLKELGITADEPNLSFSKPKKFLERLLVGKISSDDSEKLSKEGLSELYKKLHPEKSVS